MKVFYQPAQEIGGDFYDFIPIDRENLGIVIADVSGKGVPGAMIMTMARAVIRLLALGNPEAKETIIKANRFISRDIKNVMFLTLLYLVLNVRTRSLQVVNAGHNPMILWREDSYHLINPSGIAIGFDLGPIFDQKLKDEVMDLQHGDRVLVYTDGVVECMNEDGEEFGEERFLDIVMQNGNDNSAEFINVLVNALNEHQGEAEQHDDTTILTFNYL
ncbi:MAG: PP2C family protein-serine/threonine phosphatase [Planctomycetota bacterium]